MKRWLGTFSRHVLRTELDTLLALGCNIVERVETKEPLIALTFDDGPSPVGTPGVLQILNSAEVPATFFLLGANARRFPELTKEIVSAGHEVACHGEAHIDYHWSLPHSVMGDVTSGVCSIEDIAGVHPKVFRAPYGNFRRDVHSAFKNGVLIGWDVAPAWNETSARQLTEHVVHNARPGSIVLLHDGFGLRSDDPDGFVDTTVKALPDILEALKSKGFMFCTVSSLLETQAQH